MKTVFSAEVEGGYSEAALLEHAVPIGGQVKRVCVRCSDGVENMGHDDRGSPYVFRSRARPPIGYLLPAILSVDVATPAGRSRDLISVFWS